jgi:hypothetical protein
MVSDEMVMLDLFCLLTPARQAASRQPLGFIQGLADNQTGRHKIMAPAA